MTTLLSEEQQLLRDSVRNLLAAEFPISSIRTWLDAAPGERAEMSRATWRRFAEQGWLGIAWPESCGGAGLGYVEQSLVLRELGRVLQPSGYLGTLVGGNLLLEAGDPQSLELVSRVTRGDAVLAMAGTEGAEDSVCPETARLEVAGDSCRLYGEKMHVREAVFADTYIVSAREPDGGWSWVVVAADAPGVRSEVLETMDATRPLSRLHFESVPAVRVGAAGSGARLWSAVEPTLWLGLAAESVGGCEQVLADAVKYATERVQFDRPIGANQAIKHKAADMLVRAEGARAITWHAARELDSGSEDARVACSMAKSYATEAFLAVASEGIQIHGGVGFTWEFDCHFFYKRARASEFAGGHPDEHRELVAQGAGL
jgi:alkylation response protein AidB-like acyl-CoA dehydrogenase